LVFVGGFVWGAGFVYLSRVRTVLDFYIAFLVISFGWTFSSGTAVPSALIAKWFMRKRGKAIGIFAAVTGFSGLLVPLLSYLIDVYGWQRTLLMMGVFTCLVTTPISFTLRQKPEDYGLLPDGIDPSLHSDQPLDVDRPGYKEVDFRIGQAIVTPAFWLLSLASTLFYMTMSSLFVHIVPHLIASGIEARVAAMAVMFITLCSVLGRAGFGWLSDVLNKKWLLIVAFVLQGIGLFIFSQIHTVLHLIPFILAYAPSYGGGIVMRATITGEYFGRLNFGTIYGVIVGMGTFGGIAGPVVAGLAYDHYGNFRTVFAVFAFVSLFSALLMLALKRPGQETVSADQVSRV
jgi:sugar phosphate permease